jgi:hypothetical protein
MKATLWISNRVCRVLIQNSEGRVIATNDSWNNRASAEMFVMHEFPEAKIEFVQDVKRIKELNHEWDVCVLGVG